jgi:hypothetical protein
VPDRQLDDPEQRGPVLLFFGHRALQSKHLQKALAADEVVRKQTSDGVRVADVHMAVDKCRREHTTRGVDDPLGRHVAQFAGLAHMRNPLVLDDDRAVLDNPPAGVDGEHEAGRVDLQ